MPYYDLDTLLRLASGRWLELLAGAGIPPSLLDGRGHPCPKCGGHDRFAAFADVSVRGAVHCRRCFTRGTAISPCDGVATIRWWLGVDFRQAVEYLADQLGMQSDAGRSSSIASPRASTCQPPPLPPEFSDDMIRAHTEYAKQAYWRMDDSTRIRLAEAMQLNDSVLCRLRVGLTSQRHASTWPMRDERKRIVGVAIRKLPWLDDPGQRWSLKGSQSGLFVASDDADHADRLFVTEGASDTAAAMQMGLWAIGRAGCGASTYFVDRYLHRYRPTRVTLVADHDLPGIRGAKRLARDLGRHLPESLAEIEVITPPEEGADLRDWWLRGADAQGVRHATPVFSHAPPRQRMLDFG